MRDGVVDDGEKYKEIVCDDWPVCVCVKKKYIFYVLCFVNINDELTDSLLLLVS
jgi:hypothetical protein